MSRQDVLVTADWAEKNLGTDGIVFVEVDEDTTAYDGGHIPGAVKINWTNELQDPVRRDIVDKEQFEKLLSTKGIANDDLVVLYGGNNNWFAAYAYWEFKLYGHENVKLLDGGRKKWELDGRTLDTDEVSRPAATYTAKDPDLSIRAFRDEVVDSIGAKNLVDVRSPDEFSGKILAPAHLPQEQSQRPATSPRLSTCRGARPRTKTARSSRTTTCASSTPRPASTARSRPSPTAASASAPATRGWCCASCSDTATSRTTTAAGPSTAR
jgi:thiosulfate/3-mercaptopyruvate sulfurtransferase